ncbi:MAG: hypothetical protein AAGI53_00235 [Planctomycetota bacterium]
MQKFLMAGAVAAVASAGLAAETEVQFDFQGLNIQAQDAGGNASAFDGNSHTGSLAVVGNALSGSNLAITEDGAGSSSFDAGAGLAHDFQFDMSIELTNGVVTGGSLSVMANGDIYTASVVSGVGSVFEFPPNSGNFNILGLTFDGEFSGDTFAGIDVSRFNAGEPLGGSFIEFVYRPNSSGFDGTGDIDVFVTIPLPTASGLALAGLGGLAVTRRRRG